MPPKAPYIASPLQSRFPTELSGLAARARSGLSDDDKQLGVELLTEAICDLIDASMIRLLEDISTTHRSEVLQEAQGVMEDVKEKARHYLRWVTGFLASERIAPVIQHFHDMVHHLDLGKGRKPYLVFSVSPELAAEAKQTLTSLRDGTASHINPAIELMIKVVEEALQVLAITPKDLMRFNIAVDKTLNGIVSLIRALLKRILRKLGPHLPRDVYPRVAAHLESFLIIEQTATA